MSSVSVIVPVFNAEKTLAETLESVQRQTFSDLELIVIDDGSTDASRDILAAFDDDRLKVFFCANAGVATARNRGLARATGEFVSFIDADDLWVPEKLELQVEALRRNPTAGAAYSWTAFLDEEGRYLFAKERRFSQGYVYSDLLRDFFIASGSNVLLRRSCADTVGGFDPTFDSGADWEYLLRFARLWPFVVVPRYQVLYRLREDSMSGTLSAVEGGYQPFLDREHGSAPPHSRGYRESLANLRQYQGFLYLSRRPVPDYRRRAARKVFESIRLQPLGILRPKILKLAMAVLLLSPLPDELVPGALRVLLRLEGRRALLTRRELRVPAILERV